MRLSGLSSVLQAPTQGPSHLEKGGAPGHLHSVCLSPTREGNANRESAVADPETVSFCPKANRALINPLVALLLILLEGRRLPAFGLQGQGKNKAEEGSRKGKIWGEAGGEES